MSTVTRSADVDLQATTSVFQLSRFEGRTNHEIAKLLKISEKSIEYHLTKSLRELRIHMKDYITMILACVIF